MNWLLKQIHFLFHYQVEYRNEKGELHRDNDLPAIETKNGDLYWYKNGQLHRENGLPAMKYSTIGLFSNYYFINNCCYNHILSFMQNNIDKNWKMMAVSFLRYESQLTIDVFKIHFPHLLDELEKMKLLI